MLGRAMGYDTSPQLHPWLQQSLPARATRRAKRVRGLMISSCSGVSCRAPPVLVSSVEAMLVPIRRTGIFVLQTFEQRDQSKKISRTGGGKDSGNFATAAIETVRGKTGSLFMADDPMVKFRRLAQRFIERQCCGYWECQSRL